MTVNDIMRHSITLVVFLALLSACSDGERKRRMDIADSLLEINPDSSLVVMKGIDVASLCGREEKARYSLLSTMSLVRTGNIPDNDSVLNDAWEYYGDTSTPSREAMLTHYAKAAMSATPAAEFEEYEKSMSLAKGRGADFYKGAALMNMAVEFSNNGNDFKAREYLDTARPFIFNTGDSGKIVHYYYVSGIVETGNGKYDSAEKELNKGLKLAKEMQNEEYRQRLSLRLAMALEGEGRYDDVVRILRDEVYGGNEMLKLRDYFLLARGLASVGEGEGAWRIVNNLSVDSTHMSKADYYFTLSEMHVADRNFEKACHMRDSFTEYQNKLLYDIYQFNLENQLLRNEKILKGKSEKLASSKARENVYLIVILVLGVVIAVFFVRYLVAGYKRRMSEDRDAFEIRLEEKDNAINSIRASYDDLQRKNGSLIEEMEGLRSQKSKVEETVETLEKRLSAVEESRQCKEEENEGLKLELDNANREKSRLESKLDEVSHGLDRLKALQRNQFNSLHSQVSGFCGSYPKKCSRPEYESFEARRMEYLSRYQDDKYMAELSAQIDYLMEGVLGMLTAKFNLPEISIKTVILDIAGFDYICIADILGVSPNSVSSRRSRLKSMILSLAEEDLAICRRYIPMVKISS